MRPKTITYTLAAEDPNGIASDDLSGALTMSIDGDLVSVTGSGVVTFDSPRHVGITSANDDSGVTFTVTGTDRYGAALTEDITGPNATVVYGDKNFATVTSIVADGNTVGVVDAGSGKSAQTQWIPVDWNISTGYATDINISTGSMDSNIQATLDDVFSDTFDEHTANTMALAGDSPVRAIRVDVDNISGVTFTFTLIVS